MRKTIILDLKEKNLIKKLIFFESYEYYRITKLSNQWIMQLYLNLVSIISGKGKNNTHVLTINIPNNYFQGENIPTGLKG